MPPPPPDKSPGPATGRRDLAARLVDLRLALKRWRMRVKARLPFVRRSIHRRLEARLGRLADAFHSAPPADACRIHATKPAEGALGPELCLFVTHAPASRLKRHAVRHVEALCAAGAKVVLVVNTPLPPERLELDPAFVQGLGGLYVRENLGFDFAAWAHVHRLLQDRIAGCERLILANDSVVGPLSRDRLAALLARVRASPADVVGLTEHAEPRHHLQSFFLALQRRALASEELGRFWRDVRILPSKELVIAVYETWLTERLTRGGLIAEALFRNPGHGPADNAVHYRWAELIEDGLPYVKASVLERGWGTRAVRQLVPPEILDAYERGPKGPQRERG